MSDPTSKDDELAGSEQPFVQHLMELRDRMIKAILAIGVAAAFLFFFPGPGPLYDMLAAPLIAHLPANATLIATNVVSPFVVPVKILFLAAFMLALPVVLYQVWSFVAPGLYAHEKKLVLPLVISSTLLFFVGVAFSYFVVFGQVFSFIQSFAPKSITAAPDIEEYLSFVIGMFLAFGLAFEVPIAVILLVRMGVVTVAAARISRLLLGCRRCGHCAGYTARCGLYDHAAAGGGWVVRGGYCGCADVCQTHQGTTRRRHHRSR